MRKIDWLEDIVEKQRLARRVRAKAIEVLNGNDWSEVLGELGAIEGSGEASAALNAVLAERITEYTVKAMREAKKRGSKLGAATIIIAASKAK